MRRLLWLAVVFVVLSVSVPSYGYFLIYNVSCTVKGANNDLAATIPWKSYFVANLDDSNDVLVDANLIMYGQDSSKHKVYVVLNYSDANEYLDADAWWHGDYVVFDFYAYHTPFEFEGLTIGLAKAKNIGLADTMYVASSMKGTMMVWGRMLFDADDDIAGTGNVSATLDLKTTNLVNANGWTQENIVETGGDIAGKHQKSLIEKLAGYSAAVLP